MIFSDPEAPFSEPGAPSGPRTGDRRPPGGTRQGAASPFWRYVFPAVTVVLALMVPVLVFVGRSVVLDSTSGAVEERVTDPTAPGWEALAEPTPTLLVIDTGVGTLTSITVLSLTGEGTGAVVFVPISTEVPGSDLTLAETAPKGINALRGAVETVTGTAFTEVVTLTPESWAELVRPVAPLTIQNPDTVYKTEGKRRSVLFSEGSLELTADDVALYLAMRNAGESDLNRLVRHAVFWDAWLGRIRDSGDADVVPGERESGLGRFVRRLAQDRVERLTVLVEKVSSTDGNERFRASPDMASWIARVIPFPVGAPSGSRVRVRLLDGVGTLDHGLPAASALVGSGGEIVQIGNAGAFGVAQTRLMYQDDARRPQVEAMARAMGVGEVVKVSEDIGGVDVIVTLGRDYAEAASSANGVATRSTPGTTAGGTGG
jgi:hypothetical protein